VVWSAVARGDTPPPPTVAPIVEKSSRAVTTCVWWCGLRDVVTGANEDLVVAFRQTSKAGTVTIAGQGLVLQRDHSASVDKLDGEVLHTPERVVVDVGGLEQADHYSGSLTVQPSGEADPVAVPVAVDVRQGPEIPILFLLGSVLAGLLITKGLSSQPKVAFRSSALRLKDRIEAMPASEGGILLPLWEATWKLRRKDRSTAKRHMEALDKGADALGGARDVQDAALRGHDALTLVPWIQRIGNATDAVVQAVRSYQDSYDAELATVEATADQLRGAEETKRILDDLVARARAASSERGAYRDFQSAAKEVTDALKGVSPDPSELPTDLDALLAALRQRFEDLERAHGSKLVAAVGVSGPLPAGLGEIAAEAVSALGWPTPAALGRLHAARVELVTGMARVLLGIAGLAALVVLVAVGFKTTYLDNPTFGATSTDYLKLIFWGVAAYGTRVTLTGLGAAPASAA
jgi:hypothetical protein